MARDPLVSPQHGDHGDEARSNRTGMIGGIGIVGHCVPRALSSLEEQPATCLASNFHLHANEDSLQRGWDM